MLSSWQELLERLHNLLLPSIQDRTIPRRSIKEFSQLDVPALSSDDRYVRGARAPGIGGGERWAYGSVLVVLDLVGTFKCAACDENVRSVSGELMLI